MRYAVIVLVALLSVACRADTVINRVDMWQGKEARVTTFLFFDNGMELLMINWNKEGRSIEIGRMAAVKGADGLRACCYIATVPSTDQLYLEPSLQYGCPIGHSTCRFDTTLSRYISLSKEVDYWNLVNASIITPVSHTTKVGVMLTGSKTDGQPSSGIAGPVVVTRAGPSTIKVKYRCVPVGTNRSLQLRVQVATPF
ncbi:hypothetical protein COS66_03735 [Candidatus Berkelbacteria bacterium CG06_land_8_20_14_3_00_43_10]|uniref:Uncharacterized protein n=1 Tax=Candidatus Berkelbacteria bacterium CG10_big_fil_rev_8_21_14_0_10_43_14 TaxID=1974515 RepID=A0A2M6R999_9BACT|nr:MAG: hypothetical protein COT79_01160 [Candidatus Berkelbacteria bacterium CG10_big_fil_rev_8_21_14_0_10_43_14]PIU86910.1 MAG: hypothetical protein COS66_03735 [Candidatus Berkelbacteria bacterium CG06_land_8_20_14_3_00_43_10]